MDTFLLILELIGTVAFAASGTMTCPRISMLAGMAIILLIRSLSAHFRWNLPRAES